jgi:hypothetical protein
MRFLPQLQGLTRLVTQIKSQRIAGAHQQQIEAVQNQVMTRNVIAGAL